ncbi:alcohol dehydrogenase catalytic domain-containing protein [uncultured Tessaracoccus sp.]|uniref:alcohol dehydrogenase catalytic domain-containing protein n=1 Tax=uncultured Tessaracoccus sp. TaxID=905023 RepID=UPI0025FF4369|nr:alcohol dehydrogenase catalytic domain-containing protein [uncultured Tessaracoccus sp.]
MKTTGAVLEEIGRERPYARSKPLSISEVELAEPGPTEILVRIEAAGICHSDLSVVDGNRVRPVPMLLGHESAGRAERVGSDVTDIEPGQRLVMTFLPRCGECEQCRTDGRLPCAPGSNANNEGTLMSGHRPITRGGEPVHTHLGVSGFARHAVVDRRSVVPVDDDVPPAIAAVLGCAVLTGGGAIINAADPAPGESLMIVGLGGVGMAALLTAVGRGVERIIAVDALDEKLTQARELGAHETFAPEQVAEQGVKASHVVECAGNARAFETAFRSTVAGGRTVTVGLPAPTAVSEITPLTLTSEARTVIGSYLGSAVPSRDIPQYVEMWRAGKLPVEHLISHRIQLADINAAMDELADGRAVRQVILFDED